MPKPTPEVYKRWYDANRDVQKQRVKARQHALAARVRDYKSSLVCSACPESNPVCLDFHHRDPSEKEVEIALIARRGWKWERIMEEIAKCDVLCANCHRKEHARLQSVSGDAPAL